MSLDKNKRVLILGLSAAAAAVLISVPATAGAASAATASGSGRGGPASTAVPFSVRENASGSGLVLVPAAGVTRTTKGYDGLTATSPSARHVPDVDGARSAVAGKSTVRPADGGLTYVETGPFTINTQYNSNCLDADSGTIGTNGTKVQLWTCLGDENQEWYEDNYGSYARIWNADGHGYLDADAPNLGKDGTKVQLWTYIDGNTNQWWYVNGNGTIQNQSPAAGVFNYLDADLGTINADGTTIQLWQLAGGENQYWY